jgi:hypothetical protein
MASIRRRQRTPSVETRWLNAWLPTFPPAQSPPGAASAFTQSVWNIMWYTPSCSRMVLASFISPGHHTPLPPLVSLFGISRSSGRPWNCGIQRCSPTNGLHSTGGAAGGCRAVESAPARRRAARIAIMLVVSEVLPILTCC